MEEVKLCLEKLQFYTSISYFTSTDLNCFNATEYFKDFQTNSSPFFNVID